MGLLIGTMGFMNDVKANKEDIMVVNLVGGGERGSSNGAAAGETTTAIIRTAVPDEIIDFRKITEIEAYEDKEREDNTKKRANNSAVKVFDKGNEGNGSGGRSGNGQGIGAGDGTVDGNGTGYGGRELRPLVPPRLVRYVKPEYPSAARQSGIEGKVIVRVLVDANGNVASTDVYESSGSNILDEKALSSANEWEFAPAKNNTGSNIKCYVFVPIAFYLR
ncbi:MAG: energy transducer TonB [Acidaminococcaceae bacterium]